MKVYIVFGQEFPDTSCFGVCSTKEKALEAIEKLKKDKLFGKYHYFHIETELDKLECLT